MKQNRRLEDRVWRVPPVLLREITRYNNLRRFDDLPPGLDLEDLDNASTVCWHWRQELDVLYKEAIAFWFVSLRPLIADGDENNCDAQRWIRWWRRRSREKHTWRELYRRLDKTCGSNRSLTRSFRGTIVKVKGLTTFRSRDRPDYEVCIKEFPWNVLYFAIDFFQDGDTPCAWSALVPAATFRHTLLTANAAKNFTDRGRFSPSSIHLVPQKSLSFSVKDDDVANAMKTTRRCINGTFTTLGEDLADRDDGYRALWSHLGPGHEQLWLRVLMIRLDLVRAVRVVEDPQDCCEFQIDDSTENFFIPADVYCVSYSMILDRVADVPSRTIRGPSFYPKVTFQFHFKLEDRSSDATSFRLYGLDAHDDIQFAPSITFFHEEDIRKHLSRIIDWNLESQRREATEKASTRWLARLSGLPWEPPKKRDDLPYDLVDGVAVLRE